MIGDRINRGGGYEIEIPVLYHFYGHEMAKNGSRTDLKRKEKGKGHKTQP